MLKKSINYSIIKKNNNGGRMLNNVDIEFIQRNIEVNIGIIKSIFIILCTYYTNFKLTNSKPEKITILLRDSVCIVIIAIICGLVKYGVNYFISLLSSTLILSIIFSKNNIKNGILTTVISLTINYIVSFVAVITDFIINLIINLENNYINLGIIIIMHVIVLWKLLKIKKLKYGLSFLKRDEENEYLDVLILNVSVTILFATILMVNSNIVLAMDTTLGIIMSTIIMFITIQKSLQLYYKQKLLIKELEETKKEREEIKKDRDNVEKENLEISKKRHTIIHKQKILEHKIEQLAMKSEIGKDEIGEVTERIKEIKTQISEKKEEIEPSKTGIAKIDDVIKYMQTECIKSNIEFELQIIGNIYHMTNNLIEVEDLETILADHITNAIIAINHTNNINRGILVRLGEIEGIYSIYIYDTGIEFEQETLSKLGKEPSTTHASEGGTGMGFMNTFDTLRKYKASLIIKQIGKPNAENFTKAIIIKFDQRCEFKII